MDVVEISGKMYPKEDVEKAKEIIIELWEKIKEAVINIFGAVVSAAKTFIQELVNQGYTEEQAVEYLQSVIQLE